MDIRWNTRVSPVAFAVGLCFVCIGPGCGGGESSDAGDSISTSNGTTATSNGTGTTATSNGTTATSNGTTATSNGTTATSNGTTATSNGTTATSNGTTADVGVDTSEPEDTGVVDTGDEADVAPDIPVDNGMFPQELSMHWSNLEADNRVTFGKKIVVEIDDLGEEFNFPTTWRDEQLWNKRFPATMVSIDRNGTRLEIPLVQNWKEHDPNYRFRPAIVISPLPEGWPKASALELNLELGNGNTLVVPFRTLPVQFDQFKEVSVTVPMRDCPTCFPYPVNMFVFLPPGYIDPVNPSFSNPAYHLPETTYGDSDGGDVNQRYPVSVLMHTAGAYEGNRQLATAAGLRIAWGIMEPTIFVLPNARLEPDVCPDHPEVQNQNCHTRFMGFWRPDQKIFSYRDWLADDMRQYVRETFRVRGSEGTEITDPEIYRRSHGLYGLSAGGYGVMINAFSRPDAYYACVSIVPGVVSGFNPYSHYGSGVGRSRNLVCPHPNNNDYPLERHGLGYRDYSGVDPETDRTRQVHFEEREILPGSANCYQGLPAQPHNLVRGGFCQLDIACQVDPEAPRSISNAHKLREEYPYHGNIYFDTAIFDVGGPPAAFIEVDELLDRGGIPHTFRYEDRGALFHRWEAIYDRGLGYEYIQNPNGLPELRGNFPGPGSVYPFLSNAMDGVGNPEFNSPHSSEYTSSALDPDRDRIIYFRDDDRPDTNFELDNCPDVYNPPQTDKDNDGIGDLCDDDIDGDGIPNDEDPCNWPDLPVDPLDPEGPTENGCADDADADGIPDTLDICPNTFDPLQLDTDRDNFGDECENDDDGDGILDDGDGSGVVGDNPCNGTTEGCDDNCRLDQNEGQADLDGNGLGDICDPSCLLRPNGDGDGDGTPCISDCNDGDPTIYPGAEEICDDGIDQDCSGTADDGICE